MKQVFFIFVLALFVGCKQLNEKVTEISNRNEFYSAIDNSNKITFRENKATEERALHIDSCFVIKPKYVAKNNQQIQEFRSLFDGVPSTGYCCCPHCEIKIEFYNKDSINDYFFADFTSLNDSVIVFQKSFQFSKVISKESWNLYMSKIKDKNYR